MKLGTVWAQFNRFEIEMPLNAIRDCCHQGACDEDVEFWATRINRLERVTPEALRDELREYGAWDEDELADDAQNWRRIVWLAACDLKEGCTQHLNN